MSAAASQASAKTPSTALMAVRSSVLLCDSFRGPSKHQSDRLKEHAADPHLPPPTTNSARPGDRPAAKQTNPAARSGGVQPRRKTTDGRERTAAEHSCSLRITTKLSHAGPTTQDDTSRANRRWLERLVRRRNYDPHDLWKTSGVICCSLFSKTKSRPTPESETPRRSISKPTDR